MKTCAVCNQECRARCSTCRVAQYCSVDCQRQDWHWHKQECRAMAHVTDTDRWKCAPTKYGGISRASMASWPADVRARVKEVVAEWLRDYPDALATWQTIINLPVFYDARKPDLRETATQLTWFYFEKTDTVRPVALVSVGSLVHVYQASSLMDELLPLYNIIDMPFWGLASESELSFYNSAWTREPCGNMYKMWPPLHMDPEAIDEAHGPALLKLHALYVEQLMSWIQ